VSSTISISAAPSLPFGERWRRYLRRNREVALAWTILVPILLYYFFFSILPVIANLVISFTDWNGFFQFNFVGLKNYLRFFQDRYYRQVFFNTSFFAVFSMVISLPLGVIVALLLNQQITAKGVYRTLWYIPTVTSAAIISQIVIIFMAPFGGVFNLMVSTLGFKPIIWQTSVTALRTIIVGFTIWKGVGSTIVLYLAALQGIPRELYEAAEVDGAGPLQRFWYITVPMLTNMTTFVFVTGIIGGFQIFEPIQLISKGGPFNSTNVVLFQIYNDAFKNLDFGIATASATILALFLLVASIISMRALRRGEAS
jgi:ABC-type sugar transport system permease subunit